MTATVGERVLCRLEDIPDGGAKGFPPAPGAFTGRPLSNPIFQFCFTKALANRNSPLLRSST